MKVITYILEALEPLVVAQLAGDPNSVVTYPYVPGSVIRGALVNRYPQDPAFDLAIDPRGRRLFFNGATRYLNAYPLDRLGKRALPTPLAWYREKREALEDGAPVYDYSVEISDYLEQPPNYLEQPQVLAAPFCRLDSPDVEFYTPRFEINVHTARERVKGRAIEEEGGVFRFQALAAGERLGGAILISATEDAIAIQDWLSAGELWLGGSRSGGYGRVQVLEVASHTLADWREVGGAVQDVAVDELVTLTLLSDTILRGPDGAYQDRLLPGHLPAPLNRSLKPLAAFKRVIPLGGFNRKWGLPLPQTPALQAGSVFVFSAQTAISAADLQALETAGIGERRSEGCGRVAVNWHASEPVLTVRAIEPETPLAEPVHLEASGRALAETMVERLLRRDLDRLLTAYIRGRDFGDGQRWPGKTQLARLRTLAVNALPQKDTRHVQHFLSDKALRAYARDQYERARIDNVPLLAWLRARVASPETIWEQLSADEIVLPHIGDVQAVLNDSLAREYTLRVIAGVLHRASKEVRHD
jgi:CRISPR-associated protein Csx10